MRLVQMNIIKVDIMVTTNYLHIHVVLWLCLFIKLLNYLFLNRH